MDKDLWQTIETLFHQALELPENQRRQFVKQSAPDDKRLQFEVLTLLQSHANETGILESSSAPDLSDAVEKLASQLKSGHSVDGIQTDGLGSSSSTDSNHTSDSQNSKASRSFGSRNSDSANSPKSMDSRLVAMIESGRPDFVVKRVINRGGMGVVFRVYQRKLDRDVAVKILTSIDLDDRMRQRFVRESQAAAQVKNDHVVGIYEVCQDQTVPFLVMELIDGPSLDRFIRSEGQVAPTVAAELTRQIASGLEAAHNQNLIHRDIKPANILLESTRPQTLNGSSSNSANTNGKVDTLKYRARIIDFGLARDVDNPTGETQDQMFAGTLAYMSPEQVTEPLRVDHRSDIYSLGMTLYQMLTGEKPFRGAPHMILRKIEHSEPASPRKLDDRIPKDLESICLKALSKDRNRRYPTAREMADDLERFLDGRPTLARPVSLVEKTQRWIGRNKKLASLVGLAASLLILVAVGSLVFALTVQNKNLAIRQQRELALGNQLRRITDSDAGALLIAIEDAELANDTKALIPRLEEQFESDHNDINRKLNIAVALSLMGERKTEFIVDHLDELFVSPSVCRNVVAALRTDESAKEKLFESLDANLDDKAKAQRIILLAQLGDFGPWRQATANQIDPTLCTEVIHTFGRWHGDIPEFFRQVNQQSDREFEWTVIHALCLMDRRSINQIAFQSASNWVLQTAELTDHSGSYASAERLINAWGLTARSRSDGLNWRNLENGIRMVRVEPAKSKMGRLEAIKKSGGYPPHEVTITRPFFVSDSEVTVKQFLEFVNDPNCPANDKPVGFEEWNYSKLISPSDDHPIQTVNWNDAIKFCNWLSRRENLQPVYELVSEEPERSLELFNDQSVTFENWRWDPDANGYRLPHEHEFELACRGESQTKYYFGQNGGYFSDYGLATNFTSLSSNAVRSKLPNRIGLFDLHGNVWEWCNDWCEYLDDRPMTNPTGPAEPIPETFGRINRGGGVGSQTGDTDSEARGYQPPDRRYDNLGFRVARYAEQ